MIKIKARWAKASDSELGRFLVRDGKSEGVWPLEDVPQEFRAEKFDGEYLWGFAP